MVFANPLFGDAAQAGATSSRALDLSKVTFTPLPGTAKEASALGSILLKPNVLTGPQATEAALKRVSAPSVLHVATHGFFLPDPPRPPADARGLTLRVGQAAAGPGLPSRRTNPLLRAGIALAGANQAGSGDGEDGVLTALEAVGLDLWGTKLVVLSACETGLGDVMNGDGVYGLRRALTLAGAESQMMSLWQVSDDATKDLMVAYYRRLMEGEGRADALRGVQLQMLAGGAQASGGQERGIGSAVQAGSSGFSHPFYWASFIPLGDWRSLEGK